MYGFLMEGTLGQFRVLPARFGALRPAPSVPSFWHVAVKTLPGPTTVAQGMVLESTARSTWNWLARQPIIRSVNEVLREASLVDLYLDFSGTVIPGPGVMGTTVVYTVTQATYAELLRRLGFPVGAYAPLRFNPRTSYR